MRARSPERLPTLIPLPVRLLELPVTGSLKVTWMPVICQGKYNRARLIRLYDCEPKSTSNSTTVGAVVSMTMF